MLIDEEEDSDDKPVPQIPARPAGQKVAPSIPGRPKPQVPARPSKLREMSDESVEKGTFSIQFRFLRDMD